MEGLAEEALYPTRTGYNQFVFVTQFIQTKDSDDVLKFLITLKNQLHTVGSSCSVTSPNDLCGVRIRLEVESNGSTAG
jgi:hypothetical protein